MSAPSGGGAGVPLRFVVAGALALAVGTPLGAWLYHRHLQEGLYADAPAEVAEVGADAGSLAEATARVAAARGAGEEVSLAEDELNRLLFHEVLVDPDRAIRVALEEPLLRVTFCQPAADGRFLAGELWVQPYPSDEGLGLHVRSGSVGRVSISSTEGEWARERIERQLAHDIASHPRTEGLFEGLAEVRVRAASVILRFAPRAGGG